MNRGFTITVITYRFPSFLTDYGINGLDCQDDLFILLEHLTLMI